MHQNVYVIIRVLDISLKITTEFLDVANVEGSLIRKQVPMAQSARAVALAAARGLQFNLTHIYPWLAWPFPLLAWLTPRFFWRGFGKGAALIARRQTKKTKGGQG